MKWLGIKEIHYGYIVLAMATLVLTSSMGFGRFAYTLILPSMREALTLTYAPMGYISTVNVIGYLTSTLISGALASRFGSRQVIGVGILLTGLATGLTGLAQDFEFAAITQIVSGIGLGAVVAPLLGLVTHWFVPQRRGTAFGVMWIGGGLGILITGLLVPAVISTYGPQGWRYSWYLLGALILFFGLSGYLLFRNTPEEKGLIAVGATSFPPNPQPSPARLQPIKIYRSGVVLHLAFIYVISGYSYIVYLTFFVSYLVEREGFPSTTAGALWSVVGLISLVSGLLWGGLSDRIGRGRGFAVVLALQALGYILIATLKGPVGIYSSAFLYGITFSGVPAIIAAACGDYAGPRLASAVFGFVTVGSGVGSIIGPSLAGYVIDATSSFEFAFALSSLVVSVGIVVSLLLKAPRSAMETGLEETRAV